MKNKSQKLEIFSYNFLRKNRRAQMEMSIGTIVTIVLLVTLLVLGVVLIKNIFTSAKGVVDLTDEQLRSEINKLFSEDTKLSIYPGTRYVEIKQDTTDGVGFGIKNLQEGTAGSNKFSYIISATDVANCGVTKQEAESWMILGKAESDLSIPVGDSIIRKVLFNIPIGSPLCTARFKIEVQVATNTPYKSDFFDVKIKAK
jgi:hypothetical protein